MPDPQQLDAITVETLRAVGGEKWSTYPDAIGAFVAEMDFGLAAPIRDAVSGAWRLKGARSSASSFASMTASLVTHLASRFMVRLVVVVPAGSILLADHVSGHPITPAPRPSSTIACTTTRSVPRSCAAPRASRTSPSTAPT